jgi:exodeoxyribonuclease V beta subunit
VFDLCGDLPEGTTVLEASAGTGKTHTIAGLACRYLAEGLALIDELMLVTFGRAATAELRERVRERLTEVTTALGDPAAARGSGDDLVRLLADTSDAEVVVRHRRLATALADFDAATIATTHGFCHQMLAGLGIAADLDHDVTFAESTGDLVTEVATDLYVGDYGREQSPAPLAGFGFTVATDLAGKAVGDPSAALAPQQYDAGSEPEVRVRFAERARTEVARRKRSMRVMDYDDLLTYLRDALTDPETGDDACDRIRTRYRIVLVDEFQDTDPVQWQILERAFHGHRTLVLIGDPKQAIYAFRGADVVTYLAAKDVAASEATLGTNWRSDRPLVDGLRHVLGDTALGDPRIRVHEVAAHHGEASLVGGPADAPVRLRRVPRHLFGVDNGKHIGVDVARPFVARDVAADIVALLSSGAEVVERGGHRRPVEAADVAVLVHRNDDGAMVRDALAALGVPVVLSAVSSVFASRASYEWLALLSALEQPQRGGLARNAALTDFLGWDAERLALASETELDELGARLRAWGETLTTRGVAGLLEAATATGLARRVLAREGGERDLTDLRHIGQALHEAAVEGYGGVSSLVQWLQHRMAEAAGDVDEERSRRLDSDAKAVQVMTIWRAKGLEFPVVYAPFLWDKNVNVYETLRLHGPDGERVLDVGGPTGAGYPGRKAAHLAEDVGESLRLAYVALTRARCQVVAHWAPGWNCVQAPLTRLLFGDRGADGSLPDKVDRPREDAARARFEAIAASSDGLVSAETCAEPSPAPLDVPPVPVGDLSVRSFGRELDRLWRRTSYTGITAGLHEAGIAGGAGASGGLGGGGVGVDGVAAGDAVSAAGSEPEEPGLLDEPPSETGAALAADAGAGARAGARAASLVSPMAGLPVGAAFGTLVHAVLERADFAADDRPAELAAAAEAEGSARFAGIEPGDLAAALTPALATPLGPLAGGVRLADVDRSDRLDELEFELPLAGGDVPTGDVSVGQVADLVRRHVGAGDLLHGYGDDLDVPLVAERRLRGFLTGSIDAVLRVRRGGTGAPEGDTPRYLVVDYKTNWLGPVPGDGDLVADDYRPEALATAMRHAHYPLQALLYSVALHRYLRWRQPGYDPAVHLGGVLYLFLRGMCGPDTPVVDGTPHGVFAWTPPVALVTELSDMLHGGRS